MKMPELELPGGMELHFGESAGSVAQLLADRVARVLQDRLQNAPRASLAVSGGSTPVPFFQALSCRELDWGRVDVVLADERWVDESDEASNTRLVKEHLLKNKAAAARFISLKHPGNTPEDGLSAARAEFASLSLPLDALVLGMGNDGHTASLFPDSPGLAKALDPASRETLVAMSPPSQPRARISMTYGVMREAGFVALHIKGNDKLEALKLALSSPDEALAMPVRSFLKPGLQVFWSP